VVQQRFLTSDEIKDARAIVGWQFWAAPVIFGVACLGLGIGALGWFTEHGKRGAPWYVSVVMVSIVVLFFTQVLISRKILSRSLRGLDEPDNQLSSSRS